MRVAIMGSGGLGSFFGGLMTRAGADVTFISRGPNLQALRTQGLTVKLSDETEFHTEVNATDNVADIGPVDMVWFCVKSYDIEAAAEQIRPLIEAKTLVLPLQNGVEAAERIGAVIGEDHVLGGVCAGSATLLSPGVVVKNTLSVVVQFGEVAGGTSLRTEELLKELRKAGIDSELSSGIRVDIWQKFVVACMTLGLSALTRVPLGVVFANPETSALARGVMEEVEAVARAEGVQLPEAAASHAFEVVRNIIQQTPNTRGSMYFDLVQGRRLELDAMNGAVLRLGRKHAIPTPLNFAVTAALQPYAMGGLDSPN